MIFLIIRLDFSILYKYLVLQEMERTGEYKTGIYCY